MISFRSRGFGSRWPRRSVSQFFSWAVWSFQPSSVLRMNWAAFSRLTAALNFARSGRAGRPHRPGRRRGWPRCGAGRG